MPVACSPRSMFLDALGRRTEGTYVPWSISLCPAQMDRFERAYGHRDPSGEWGLAHRHVHAPFHATADDFSGYHPHAGESTRIDEWGIGHRASDDGSHFTRLVHPLHEASLDEVVSYPFPEPAGADDLAALTGRVDELHARGLAAVGSCAPVGGTVFWPAYKLRGMEQLLCDLVLEPERARILLDRVTEICARHARTVCAAGVDIIHMADDLGTQHSTYMSPSMFNEWIKPRLAQVIGAAREANPDVLVHFHSDGAVEPFIDDFIEIGVDIINPVQPECMDPYEVKRMYGERVSLSGAIGTQTTMPFGTPRDVRDAVRRACELLGRGGGYWLAPTHVIEPEVPWENVMAFVETAREFSA